MALHRTRLSAWICLALASFTATALGDVPASTADLYAESVWENNAQMMARGRRAFRHDTYGNQDFWGGRWVACAIAGTALGGVGPGLSPAAALELGLKVDRNALPKSLQRDLKRGAVDLTSPATTVALLRLNAVVGVQGYFDGSANLKSVGITCAICHSTVDDSLGERYWWSPRRLGQPRPQFWRNWGTCPEPGSVRATARRR